MIGREQDIVAISALLRQNEVRLLTLVGAAGVGKTRLALQMASILQHQFPQGCHMVSLAAVNEPRLVLPSILQALGLGENQRQSPYEILELYLHNQRLLLLLDNFEQVTAAAPEIISLLQSCCEIKIVVTSREMLNVRAEYLYVVSPLELPAMGDTTVATIAKTAAVRLFVKRARAVKPDFQITEANARLVAAICLRLDGLPLAIELAATRIRFFPPQELLKRLDQPLKTLIGGPRDLPERQQTLYQTIRWSYDLLDERAQCLLRRLAVFIRGCTLEECQALNAHLNEAETDVLPEVQSLIDKHLLTWREQAGGGVRLLLLETIQAYGWGCLRECGETALVQHAHANLFLQLAESVDLETWSPRHRMWFDRLAQEQENLRAALNWFIQQGAREQALRLACSLTPFWIKCAQIGEGRVWLEQALALCDEATEALQARALKDLALLFHLHGEFVQAEKLFQESLLLFQKSGDVQGIALCLERLGSIARLGKRDFAAAQSFYEESLQLARQINSSERIAAALFSLGLLSANRGEASQAQAFYEACLAITREDGDQPGETMTLIYLAYTYRSQGDDPKARLFMEKSLRLARELNDSVCLSEALVNLARILCEQNEVSQARLLAEESLVYCNKAGLGFNSALSLVTLGNIALTQGEYTSACDYYEKCLHISRELGFPSMISESLEGLESVAVYVQASSQEESMAAPELASAVQITPQKLTRRELEVLRLLAQGLSDALIAEKLTISLHTVHAHTRSIYTRLGVSSRTAAVAYAFEHKLV
ncbi:MAG TPA: tetratricopeptide repeat protein [Ktedonobacteraceae bacterium]|nr:tetratricopeptide repeat protein [Ktedonobacteraceae bacterium]